MKRSAALAPLSRDHHAALEIALRLRRAQAGDAPEAIARFVAFIDGDGARHFAAEEQVLLPHTPGALAARTRSEHADLRARADALRAAGDAAPVDDARAAGEALSAHVRFEERELFPELEALLDDAALAELGARL